MDSSQLAIEYESMAERHELYARFGIAAEAAQLFETELGSLLLMLRGLENKWHIVPDGTAAREVLDHVDRSTLGRVLNNLKRLITIEGDLEQTFTAALQARNRLSHGFFERHDFKIQSEGGRRIMIADLDDMHGELFAAWQLASFLTNIMTTAVKVSAEAHASAVADG